MPISRLPLRIPIAGAIGILILAAPAAAQSHAHSHEHAAPGGLHLAHPIVGESVAPDTKVLLEYQRSAGVDGSAASAAAELTLAYAPARRLGVELGLPLHHPAGGEGVIGAPHLGLHLASFALERHGIVLGYGVEVQLGDAEGQGHAAHAHAAEEGAGEEAHAPLQARLGAGYKVGGLELIASARAGITRHAPLSGFGYNASALYSASSRVQPVLEVYGESAGGSHGAPVGPVHLAPGLRVQPVEGSGVRITAGYSAPLLGRPGASPHASLGVLYHW